MMLQLGAGMQTIEGVTVFPDSDDEEQWWYLASHIDLARRPQDGRPAFTFMKFKRAATASGVEGGGFLVFTVELGLPERVERAIRAELPTGIRLSAVPFDSGSVECVALNLQGPGGTVATVGDDGSFVAVEQILGASVPSLFGNNTAMFSLTLSQEGATLLEAAFAQGATPIGVIYKLSFTAMQPALNVKITAKLDRVYEHFSAGLSANIYYVEIGIEAGIEKLIQDGAITIEVTNYSTETDRADQEREAINFFKENLLKDWFTPTLTPGSLQGGMATTPRAAGGAALFGPGSSGSNAGGNSPPPDRGRNSAGGRNGPQPPPTPPTPTPPPGPRPAPAPVGGARPPERGGPTPTPPGPGSGSGPNPPPTPGGGTGGPTPPQPGRPTGPSSPGAGTGAESAIMFRFAENGSNQGVHGRYRIELENGSTKLTFRTPATEMSSNLEARVPADWDRCDLTVQALTLPVIAPGDEAQLRSLATGETTVLAMGERPAGGTFVFDELRLNVGQAQWADVTVSIPTTETRFIATDAEGIVDAVLPGGRLAHDAVYDVRPVAGNEYVMIAVGDPEGTIDQTTGDSR